MKDWQGIKSDMRLKVLEEGPDGAQFMYRFGPKRLAVIIFSFGERWEHASVHVRKYNSKRKATVCTPTWDDMCIVKDLFFGPEETVLQYHPADTEYVNDHDHVLHLWRPMDEPIPTPPNEMV